MVIVYSESKFGQTCFKCFQEISDEIIVCHSFDESFHSSGANTASINSEWLCNWCGKCVCEEDSYSGITTRNGRFKRRLALKQMAEEKTIEEKRMELKMGHYLKLDEAFSKRNSIFCKKKHNRTSIMKMQVVLKTQYQLKYQHVKHN